MELSSAERMMVIAALSNDATAVRKLADDSPPILAAVLNSEARAMRELAARILAGPRHE